MRVMSKELKKIIGDNFGEILYSVEYNDLLIVNHFLDFVSDKGGVIITEFTEKQKKAFEELFKGLDQVIFLKAGVLRFMSNMEVADKIEKEYFAVKKSFEL